LLYSLPSREVARLIADLLELLALAATSAVACGGIGTTSPGVDNTYEVS